MMEDTEGLVHGPWREIRVDPYRDAVTVFMVDVQDFVQLDSDQRLRAYIDGNSMLHVKVVRVLKDDDEKVVKETPINLITIKGNFIVEWRIDRERYSDGQL